MHRIFRKRSSRDGCKADIVRRFKLRHEAPWNKESGSSERDLLELSAISLSLHSTLLCSIRLSLCS
jgi:hypothetical protein